jgi:hypothetical protein
MEMRKGGGREQCKNIDMTPRFQGRSHVAALFTSYPPVNGIPILLLWSKNK